MRECRAMRYIIDDVNTFCAHFVSDMYETQSQVIVSYTWYIAHSF